MSEAVRYQVPVSRELLDVRPWAAVAGLRLLTVDGPWHADRPDVILCTFEDDGAPDDLAGKIVDVTLSADCHEGDVGAIRVTGRMVINGKFNATVIPVLPAPGESGAS